MVARAKVDDTLAALADPTRRRVVELLKIRPKRAGDLADSIGVSPQALSRHLRVLREKGVIEEIDHQQDARARYFQLRQESIRQLRTWVSGVEELWAHQLEAFKTHLEKKP